MTVSSLNTGPALKVLSLSHSVKLYTFSYAHYDQARRKLYGVNGASQVLVVVIQHAAKALRT